MIESKWLEEWFISLEAKSRPPTTQCAIMHDYVDGICSRCKYPEFPPNVILREGELVTLDDDLGVEDHCVKMKP